VDRLTGPEAERPTDTREAIALMRSVTWPADVPPPRAESATAAPVLAQLGGRLQQAESDGIRDSVLERSVLVLAAEGAAYELALSFARADHPALASVLCYQADEESVWIEDFPDSGASAVGTLSEQDRSVLAQALEALHRAGAAHGAVNRVHLRSVGDQLLLRFPVAQLHHDPARDLADLAAL
jgi:serine/threonine-protein kinase